MSEDPSFDPGEKMPSLAELMARMATPETPKAALAFATELTSMLVVLDPIKTLPIVAGLMTLPKFQANYDRLDWAIRLVMGLGRGTRKPKKRNLEELLNRGLMVARVGLFEDPVEEFFVDHFPTPRGGFLIFPGRWERAASYTETLIRAFERLPNGEKKDDTLRQAYALLRLSNELVRRAGLQRRVIGEGLAASEMELPSDFVLGKLAARVRFSAQEIVGLGIEPSDLEAFTQSTAEDATVLDVRPGDSRLEFQPLLQTKQGLVVAAPANLSIAVRAFLIDVAVQHKLGRMLQYHLLREQSIFMRQGNFRLLPNGPVREVDGCLIHATVEELSPGRYAHVIQSVDGFAGWPVSAFGGLQPCSPS